MSFGATSDQVTSAIKSCRNSRAYGPDSLSIFHLKNLVPLAIEHLTALYNDSLKSCHLPSIWKTTLVIPIPKPGKDSSQGTSYRPISLLCPAAKVLEALILPTINEFLSPAKDQHGFRPRHSTTSALLQLTTDKDCSLSTSYRPISLLCPAAKVMEALLLPTVNSHLLPFADQHGFRPGHSTSSALLQLTSDIASGFNQRKPPHRTVCVAVDLTAAFDTVNHNVLLSKIVRSTLPEATCRWLSNYLRGRQSVTSCRGVKSKARIVHTGVPQGSKMSPTLFSFYLADMPRPTEPVKRICYADDITVWASGVKLPELEHKINDYLTEMSRFLRDNSLLISAPKSTVTLFTQTQSRPILTQRSRYLTQSFPLFAIQSCWEVYLDTFFSFNTHCVQVATESVKEIMS